MGDALSPDPGMSQSPRVRYSPASVDGGETSAIYQGRVVLIYPPSHRETSKGVAARLLALIVGAVAVGLVVAPIASATYAASVTADSPSAYWRLGESSGTIATDQTANANSGTYLNGPTLGAPGAVGDGDTGATLDGANDYVRALSSASLNPTSAITLEAWVKPRSGAFTSSKPVFAKGYSSWAAPYYQYDLSLYDAGASPKYLQFGIAVGGARVSLGVANSGWRSDVWNHLAATYDGAMMRLYVTPTSGCVAAVAGTRAPTSPARPGAPMSSPQATPAHGSE